MTYYKKNQMISAGKMYELLIKALKFSEIQSAVYFLMLTGSNFIRDFFRSWKVLQTTKVWKSSILEVTGYSLIWFFRLKTINVKNTFVNLNANKNLLFSVLKYEKQYGKELFFKKTYSFLNMAKIKKRIIKIWFNF